jgi:hypothetical protein
MKVLFLFIVVIFVTVAGPAGGQTPQPASNRAVAADPGITPSGVIGAVRVINSPGKQMTIRTDAGNLVTVALGEKTNYLRLSPGEQALTNAMKIAFPDVAEGDRVWARGRVAQDHESVLALTLVVMTKGDIAKKQEQERLEWRQRGILGVILLLKPDSKEITISTRSGIGSQPVIIPISSKLDMRRYAPDSINFSEAKPGTFDELKVGDQVRALGDKSTDGTHFAAERVVSGSFQTVAGKVTGVDSATGELKINNLQTKQPLTVVIKADSVLRKFSSSQMGAMPIGGRPPGAGQPAASGSGGRIGQEPPPRAVNKPEQGAGAALNSAAAGQGAGRRAIGPNLQEMLDRLPTISAADIKVGDTIIVSSTRGADPSRLTAITLISGADTLLALLAPGPQPGTGQARPNPAAGLGSGITFGIGLP